MASESSVAKSKFAKQTQFVFLTAENAEIAEEGESIVQNKANPSGTSCRTGFLDVEGVGFVANFKNKPNLQRSRAGVSVHSERGYMD